MRPTTKTFINKLKKINLRGEYKGTNEMGADLVCVYNKETMQTILIGIEDGSAHMFTCVIKPSEGFSESDILKDINTMNLHSRYIKFHLDKNAVIAECYVMFNDFTMVDGCMSTLSLLIYNVNKYYVMLKELYT